LACVRVRDRSDTPMSLPSMLALLCTTSALVTPGRLPLRSSLPLVPENAVRLAVRPIACAEDTSSGIQVSLRDPETDRALECHVLQTTGVGGKMYASMTPIDTPVAIALLEDGTMVEVDNPAELDTLFPTAQAVCSEMDLALLQTPVTLTIAGELDGVDEDEEEGEEGEAGADLAELDEAEEVDEDEGGVEVLSAFYHEDVKYYLVMPLEPFVVVGRQVAGAKFDIPEPSEMQRVGPELEMLMQQSMAELENMDEGE